MADFDPRLANGEDKISYTMPFAVRDLIFGIPNTQITLAYDETSGKELEIQEYNLISRNILYIFHWLRFPVSAKFKNNLLEAMRIAVIMEHHLGTYRIYYNQAKSNGKNELTLVNWWNQDKGLFRFPVFPSAVSTFSDFGGRVFIVPVLHKPPWNFVTYENGTFFTDGGRDDQLLKLLASKLNFRFEYIDPPERIQGLGIAVNGTFRGVLGLIERREASFFLGDVTITYDRFRIVDFSSPTLADCGTFATHSPRLLNEALALVRPFHWQVWIPVAATALLSGPVLFTVIEASTVWRRQKYKTKTSKLLQDCIWFSVGMFLRQSVKEPSRMHKARLLMILMSIIATYVIGGLYSATLTSLLARPAREKPIRTLFDLEEAVTNKGYQLLVERRSSSHGFLQNGTGVYGRLWEYMRGYDVLVDSVEEGMRRVQDVTSMAAIFAGRETLFFDSRRFGAHHFHLGDCLFTRYSAIAMQIGSPFRENFDRLIIRLFEAGILTKMTRDEYERLREKVDKVNGTSMKDKEESDLDNAEDKVFKTSDHSLRSYSNDEASGLKKNSKSTEGSPGGGERERKLLKPVSVKMLQGAFYMLLIGCSISCLVLCGERLLASREKYISGSSNYHIFNKSNLSSAYFLKNVPSWKWKRAHGSTRDGHDDPDLKCGLLSTAVMSSTSLMKPMFVVITVA
ncbi:ionotropic receptor 40a-like [Hetaerina americana]|uniref:ionotropic receptor 40a-like n=1 Tax=Hetaerina americana TaxID=62018 RepID=UPI003A7F306E